MTIERRFDVSFIASLALKEKQIQQNYRPIIAVHKWFARRPGALFRGLVLSEFGDEPVRNLFYRANDFPDKTVADPFMGGGIPLIEANRTGCAVIGFDINPMAAWIVREEIEYLDIEAYTAAARRHIDNLRANLESYYQTDCPHYGDKNVPVKYFLWVKTLDCENCGQNVDLFPGYRIAKDRRHPQHVLVCSLCGELNEVASPDRLGECSHCNNALLMDGPARRGRCPCSKCGHQNSYPQSRSGPLEHRLFAIEYHNPIRKSIHKGRFFKKPDKNDLKRLDDAEEHWRKLSANFVPEQEILPGDETDRLHRWGYRFYRDLFNARQLLGLEISCDLISKTQDERIMHALATNLSDLLRYQNLLCRYDTMALKSLDIFSIHGFPVGLIQCESNILGIKNGNGANVGSGGWSNIVDKYTKAKKYCMAPFEIRVDGQRKTVIPIKGEWIGERKNGEKFRDIEIHCLSSTRAELPAQSLDAVFTDPPYFGNVQYGELMDFCYVWLRRLVGDEAEGFDNPSTRQKEELTGSVKRNWGLDRFASGLAEVYGRMARSLKPGAPLAFTFHHNNLDVYVAVGVAILDAGLNCSASLPCPAEMGGSIHIHGTTSSIIDTIFVCRTTGSTKKKWLFKDVDELTDLVTSDLEQLRAAGVKPTFGDIRCIAYGHMTRMAIWNLREHWKSGEPMQKKIGEVREQIVTYGGIESIVASVEPEPIPKQLAYGLFEEPQPFEGVEDAISF